MVQYFGERLDGFATTRHGWVQSYGTRYVRPPILYGDVARSAPITVGWTRYAQSLTAAPVKGMLTGPVTILQWSFVRADQPRAETCRQIALAIRDEVADLDLLGDLVRGPPGLVLVDGERLQPRVVALRVVHEPHRGHVRLDDVDLLQWGDDQQLQAEPAEQLQREPGRLVRAAAERLVDDREPERP